MKAVVFLLFFSAFAFAQNKQDRQAIKAMCGCHEVTFEFGETFSPLKDYKFHENYYSTALEWVQLVEDTKKRIVLQHILIVQDSTGKQDIVKHWRQDWLYENTDFYMYDKDNTWKFVRLPKNQVKGQWTQKVYQVDDSPRYEGSATWIHADGRHYWENTTDSPLPRREFTKRNDYNVLRRRNRHEIMPWGWLHEQDNDKILRQNGQDKLIAREKGWDTYRKVDDKRCELAQKWWAENQKFWAEVRKEWDNIFKQGKTLRLTKTIDGKPMFMHIFALKLEETAQIRPIIQKFIEK
jgi:hypothetical protein